MGSSDFLILSDMSELVKIVIFLIVSGLTLTSSKRCKQDEEYSCPDGQTCCPLPPGQGIGCCPYPEATCCKDKMHCCPSGMACDVKSARCEASGYQLLFSKLRPRSSNQDWSSNQDSSRLNRTQIVEKKFCPDHSFTCSEDQTCCLLKTGDWGCCPLGADAVCCSDQEHCCPHLTQCDLAAGTCTPN